MKLSGLLEKAGLGFL